MGKATVTAKIGKLKLKCKIKVVSGRVKHSKKVTGLHSNGLWYKGRYVDYDYGKISKIKQALLTDPKIQEFKRNYIKSGMSDVEKVLAIQKYLLNTGCLYTETKTLKLANYNKCPYCEFCRDAMGVLYSKQGVCEDYASATKLLCIVCDIPCITVKSEQLNHRWCRIKIQGKWYNWDTVALKGYWGSADRTRELNLNGAIISEAYYCEEEFWNASVCSYDEYKLYGLKKLPKADTSEEIWYVLVDRNDDYVNQYLAKITNITFQQGDILKISCDLKDTKGTLGMWKIMQDNNYKKFNVSVFKHASSIQTDDYKNEKEIRELWKKYSKDKTRKNI